MYAAHKIAPKGIKQRGRNGSQMGTKKII